jgi:YD repeat-containing protein
MARKADQLTLRPGELLTQAGNLQLFHDAVLRAERATLDRLLHDQLFQRDAAGRIRGSDTRNPITRETESHSYFYTYDLARRLTTVTRDGVVWESYGYDSNGNRTSWTDPWGSGTATYDPQDRLLACTAWSFRPTLEAR